MRAESHVLAAVFLLSACGTDETKTYGPSVQQPVVGASSQSQCLTSDDVCAPMDATLEDFNCDTGWGYEWDGEACNYLGGACQCFGDDCDNLYPSQQACESAVADCGSSTSSVSIAVDGNTMTISDDEALFNCCLEAWMEVTINGNHIVVVEVEETDAPNACDCECPYELAIEVSNLAAGSYTVSVYRGAVTAETLLHEQSVNL